MSAVIVLAVAALAAVWVSASPARLIAAGVAAVVAHPALMLGVTTAVVTVVAGFGAVVVWRSVAGSGWLLIAVQARPVGAGWVGVRHG
jgi:hypothetical protein